MGDAEAVATAVGSSPTGVCLSRQFTLRHFPANLFSAVLQAVLHVDHAELRRLRGLSVWLARPSARLSYEHVVVWFSPDDEESQQSYVWVVDEETLTVRRTPVEPVRTSARGVEVRGLQGGQRIATAGVRTLREGQQVRLAAEAGAGS